MLQSKLKTTYPTADPEAYIIGDHAELDPIFAGRLAQVAKTTGTKIKLTEGYRSTARQTELYNQYLQYLKTGKGSIKLAAKPGKSWHEYRLAVDTSTQPIRGMNNTELAPYGLCKPINSEGWHIQPIETKGLTDRTKFAPTEVKEKQEEEDMVKVYEKIEELTGDWKESVKWALDKGIIKGNGKTLGLTESEVKGLVFMYRDNLRKGTK